MNCPKCNNLVLTPERDARITALEEALCHLLEVQVDHNPADPELMAVHKAEVDAAVCEARRVYRG